VRDWKILCCLINRLLELLDWYVSGLNWFTSMHGLFLRVVLRNNRSDSSDRSLRRRKIFCCLGVSVFELLDWDLSGVNWFIGMHGVFRGLILRHYRP